MASRRVKASSLFDEWHYVNFAYTVFWRFSRSKVDDDMSTLVATRIGSPATVDVEYLIYMISLNHVGGAEIKAEQAYEKGSA